MKKLRSFVAAALALMLIITSSIMPVSAFASEYDVISFSHINPLYEDLAVQPKLYTSYASSERLLTADTYSTLSGAGATLRDAMEERTPTVVVGYVADGTSHTTEQVKTYAKNIF